jgi:hypothetical protein
MNSSVPRFTLTLSLIMALITSLGVAVPAQATTLQVVSATLGPDGKALSLPVA